MTDLNKDLLTLEEAFWEASSAGDGDFYRNHAADDAVFVFYTGTLDKQACVDAIDGHPVHLSHWRIDAPKVVALADDTALLTYRGYRRHEGETAAEAALTSSVYVQRNGEWKLAFHQQTPLTFKDRMELAYREGTARWDTGRPCGELQRRLEAGDFPARGKALDLGCGSGTQSMMLAEHGLDVVGLDLSETAIAMAQERAAEHPERDRFRFVAGDITQTRGIGEPFDVIVDRGCYHLARRENVDGYLDALKAFSKPGTVLFVLAFNADSEQEFPDLPVVTERELRSELGRYFDFVDLRSVRLDKPEGFEHEPVFWSALLKRP